MYVQLSPFRFVKHTVRAKSDEDKERRVHRVNKCTIYVLLITVTMEKHNVRR